MFFARELGLNPVASLPIYTFNVERVDLEIYSHYCYDDQSWDQRTIKKELET